MRMVHNLSRIKIIPAWTLNLIFLIKIEGYHNFKLSDSQADCR